MNIGLLNWSGHDNLGDDTMARILVDVLKREFDVENLQERFEVEKDAYVLGGGTLICPGSRFLNLLSHPERTIGFSLGVSSNWGGEWLEVLKRMPAIYVRDDFSYRRLKAYGLTPILSVDLLCALEEPGWHPRTVKVWNAISAKGYTKPDVQGLRCIRMSKEDHDEDNSLKFQDGYDLVEYLGLAEEAHLTRLHAVVCAWIAGVPRIIPDYSYDQKIRDFMERVMTLTPSEARRIIYSHLNDLCQGLRSLRPQSDQKV